MFVTLIIKTYKTGIWYFERKLQNGDLPRDNDLVLKIHLGPEFVPTPRGVRKVAERSNQWFLEDLSLYSLN